MKRPLLLCPVLLALAAAGCGWRVKVTGQPRPAEYGTPPYLSWQGQIEVKEVPGTGVFCLETFNGERIKEDICGVGKNWYRFYKGHWFAARKWRGPWKLARGVPDNFLKIPKDHPRHTIAERHPAYEGQ